MKRKRPREIHIFRRSYMRHAVPVIVWLGAVATVGWLFQERSESIQIVGIAQSEVHQVASDCTARITDIQVELFQPVKAGQTLAVLNTVPASEWAVAAELQAKVATSAAEIEQLMASLIPTQERMLTDAADLQIGLAGNRRRFAVDVESARLHVLRLQAAMASEQITLNGLALELQAAERLVEEKAISPFELERVRIQHDSTAKTIQEYEQQLQQARADQVETERRYEEFLKQELPLQSIDEALEAIHKAVKVRQEVMKGLQAQIAALQARTAVELKSPIDGVIIPISGRANEVLLKRPGEETIRRPGEVISAGEPILAVAQTEPTEILAYASEKQIGRLEKDMAVELVKIRHPAQIARSRVVSVGPTIELMPQRLWRSANMPQWGRPLVVEIPPGLMLVPGELVGIRGL